MERQASVAEDIGINGRRCRGETKSGKRIDDVIQMHNI